MPLSTRSSGRAPVARRHLRPAVPVHPRSVEDTSRRVQIVDAALGCLADRGLAKTTVDDIATAAGISRATLYRVFPGGRDAVLAAVVATEQARLFGELAVEMGEAADLAGVLVAGIAGAARRLAAHRAIATVLAQEPGVLLPQISFDGLSRLLSLSSAFAAPFLARWLEPDQALRAAEWAARIAFSYLAAPPEGFDVTDPVQVRRLVERFVLPGVLALRSGAPAPAGTTSGPAGR